MKYKLTDETKVVGGITLYRIEAVEAFSDVEAGEKGGFIESEKNLDQDQSGDAWVYGNAQVYGDAAVFGDARVEKSFDYMLIGPIGSRESFTTFYRTKDGGISVSCGCFYGTLDEFAAKVEQTHADNQHGKSYRAAIELVRNTMGIEKG